MFATGPARARLVEALLEAARRGPPNIPPLPELFQHFRRELGAEVYGSMGIAREDKEGRAVAVMRNFEYFRAPRTGIVCLHRDLGPADALSVGMFLQTFLLALTERGLGSCVEVSVASRSHPHAVGDPTRTFDNLQSFISSSFGGITRAN